VFTIFINLFLENMLVEAKWEIAVEFLNLITPTGCDTPLDIFSI
jgi:hypothetical protein